MATIIQTAVISAPIEKCFDLARSVEVHLLSTKHTKERVVAGRTSGLFEANETVTWEAIHFGMKQQLTSLISKMEKPIFFEDTMLKGAFKSLRHEHHFEEKDGKTFMKDIMRYETPYGIFGKLFDKLILEKYLSRFLRERNEIIKQTAENTP